jgi:hypothetical protein
VIFGASPRRTTSQNRHPTHPTAIRAWMNSASSCWALTWIPSTQRGCLPIGARICPVDSDEIRQREDEILNIFVDICSLFQREPEVNHRASGEEPSAEALSIFLPAHAGDARSRTPASLCQRASTCAGSLRRPLAGSLPGTGRELALDLQIASTRGTAGRTQLCASSNGVCDSFRGYRRRPKNPFGRFSAEWPP